MDVDATGVKAGKVSDQLFKGGRRFKRIFLQNFQQVNGLFFQTSICKLLCVFCCLLRKYHLVFYHSKSFKTVEFSMSSCDALMIDSA
jgi:hypothetical protein